MPGVTMAEAKSPTTRSRPGKRRRLSAQARAVPTSSDRTVVRPAWIAVMRSRCGMIDARLARRRLGCGCQSRMRPAGRAPTQRRRWPAPMAAPAIEPERAMGQDAGYWTAASSIIDPGPAVGGDRRLRRSPASWPAAAASAKAAGRSAPMSTTGYIQLVVGMIFCALDRGRGRRGTAWPVPACRMT